MLFADVHLYLFLSFSLFAIGIYGLISRKSLIRMLFSLEIIVNSANLNLIVFSTQRNIHGEVFTFFTMGLATLEAAVGITIAIVFYKRFGDTMPFKIKNLRW